MVVFSAHRTSINIGVGIGTGNFKNLLACEEPSGNRGGTKKKSRRKHP
jgi:hypothetical protein